MSSYEKGDGYYTIPKVILTYEISTDEINTILDKHIDSEHVSSEEQQTIVMYCMQLFYRSDHKETSTSEIHEKYNNLIASRVLEHLNGMNVIEPLYDPEEDDFVYALTDLGKDIIQEIKERKDD